MIAGGTAVFIALVYLCALFALAHFANVYWRHLQSRGMRTAIYALSLCVYCTSWTYFGSVGLASATGWDFVPVYLGPVLVFLLGRRVIIRVLRLTKAHNITSVADFLGARYGKSEMVAMLTALICVIGVVPYLALQLKAVSESLITVSLSLTDQQHPYRFAENWHVESAAAIILAFFTIAFGTRRLETTGHQNGLMLAIAAESLVKLVAVLTVGVFVTFYLCDGPVDVLVRIVQAPSVGAVFNRWPDPWVWLTITLLSACAVLLLPRQFHAAIVENRNETDVHTAAWFFPAYLVLINLFVVPIAIVGLVVFPDIGVNRDMTILALPLHAGAGAVALVVMVGGFSAATAMVILSCVALSIMVSNELVMPLFLRSRMASPYNASGDISSQIMVIRRVSIVLLLALAVVYLRISNEAALAAIGLRSFAAIAQLAPAFLGALFWSRGNARGAAAGLVCGILAWVYTLLLPSLGIDFGKFADAQTSGSGGFWFLRPTAILGLDLPELVHGVVVSLSLNIIAYIGFSLSRAPNQIESIQASIFVEGNAAPADTRYRLWHSGMTLGELELLVARYLGKDRARQAFADFAQSRTNWSIKETEVDLHMMQFAEQSLTAVIGAASSRLVMALALQQRNLSYRAAQDLADETSAAIHYNRELLQHAIDFARQGISIFDKDMRLVFWNREFREMCQFPIELLQFGVSLRDLIRHHAKRGLYGPGEIEAFVTSRLKFMANTLEPYRLSYDEQVSVIELRSSPMPDGGLVVTYTDVSQQVEAERALAQINETLEHRVRQRTEELEALNVELVRAKAIAEDANLSKTRFLAAASHDILQPLNAARLFATALSERMPEHASLNAKEATQAHGLARNIDASLESVEEILTTLLDMSRLDAGAMKPEIAPFRIDEIFAQLKLEFEPVAREKNLKLTFVPCSLTIRSDRRLMRRLLQNLISNAIKYTPDGRVLVGCRRRRSRANIEVWDTGLGIPDNKRKAVFREFERLDAGARAAQGLGLGLSIVERLARVLNLKIVLRSVPGKGSVFSVETVVASALPATVLRAGETAGKARHRPLAGMVVVSIDNEPRILEGMRELLGGWGCNIFAVESLAAAEAALLQARLVPAAIIADYHLGEAAGIDVIMALRSKFGVEIPAVLLTADRSQVVRLEAEVKNIKLLNKPLKPAALRALLTQWLVNRVAAE